MKKVLLYSLAAFVSFSLFLILSAPAAPLWSFFGKDLNNKIPQLDISSIQGKLWNGRAKLNYRAFPTSILTWDINTPPLAQKTVDVDLQIEGESHRFSANLKASQNNIQIQNLNGRIDADYINRVSENLGLTFTGTIDLEAFNIKAINVQGNQKRLSKAEGHIAWDGGQIVSRTVASGTQVFDLPPLRGDFSINASNGGLQLDIYDNEQILIEITLKPDGWAAVKIKVGLFQLAGLSWQGDLNDNVIEIEEKVL